MRGTVSAKGKNAAWPGRRRYPAAPGCPLATIGNSSVIRPTEEPGTSAANGKKRRMPP